ITAGEAMIDARQAEVLVGDALGGEIEEAEITIAAWDDAGVRQRPEGQIFLHGGIDTHVIHAAVAVMESAIARRLGRNGRDDGSRLRLADAFIVDEIECFVPLNGPAERGSELIATELGNASAIEEIA